MEMRHHTVRVAGGGKRIDLQNVMPRAGDLKFFGGLLLAVDKVGAASFTVAVRQHAVCLTGLRHLGNIP